MSNRYLKIPIDLDQDALEADLQRCLGFSWTGHFNKRDYEGDWNVLSLRSSNGAINDITSHPEVPFKDTPLMEVCTHIKSVLSNLDCNKESVRLLRLAPGSKIHTHRDLGTGYQFGNFRLHIPLRSGEGVSFIVDGEKIPMKKGECWYADFDLPHSVSNTGADDRIHLVIDCVRNEWSDALFKSAGYNFDAEGKKAQDPETIRRMIEELELMDSAAARTLITELKKKLHV